MNKNNFNLKFAVEFARQKHRGQTDLNGVDYFGHLENVAGQLEGEKFKIAGYLHDTIEDTPTSYEELLSLGCPKDIADAVVILTHKKPKLTREEFLEEIRLMTRLGNQIAIDVKWADITHNSDISRLTNPQQKDFERKAKYDEAKQILKPFVNKYLLQVGK